MSWARSSGRFLRLAISASRLIILMLSCKYGTGESELIERKECVRDFPAAKRNWVKLIYENE
jgi:hypothetical protein